jgi:hypothetical protein
MITNLGDNVLVDVERHDRERSLPPFNGRVPGLSDLESFRQLPRQEQDNLAVRVVGVENVPTRALQSLPLIGHTLAGRPQVASTVQTGSGLAALVARTLLLDREPIASGRYRVALRGIVALAEDDAVEQRDSALQQLGMGGGSS